MRPKIIESHPKTGVVKLLRHSSDSPAIINASPSPKLGAAQDVESNTATHKNHLDAPQTSSGTVVSSTDCITSRSTSRWYGAWPQDHRTASFEPVGIFASNELASEAAQSLKQTTKRESVGTKIPSLLHSPGASNRSSPLDATITKLNIPSSSATNHLLREVSAIHCGMAVDGSEVLHEQVAAGLCKSGNTRAGNSGIITNDSENAQAGTLIRTDFIEKETGNVHIIHDERAKERRLSKYVTNGENVGSVESIGETAKIGLTETLRPAELSRSAGPSFGIQCSWLGWFPKIDTVEHQSAEVTSANLDTVGNDPKTAVQPWLPRQSKSGPNDGDLEEKIDQRPSRSWLGAWGTVASPPEKGKLNPSTCIIPQVDSTANMTGDHNLGKSTAKLPPGNATAIVDTAKSAGWAFWSRSISAADIMNEANLISATREVLESSQPEQEDRLTVDTKRYLNSMAVDSIGNSASGESTSSRTKSQATNGNKSQKESNNLVLPSFRHTFPALDRPGFLAQIGRLFYPPVALKDNHLTLIKNPPRIKNALAIGVHGYFPAPLIRSVLGQPTGTSVKFAEFAATSIEAWTHNHGYSCKVEKIALEGEGKVEERVDLLWKLMLNWIEDIRQADLIMVACHSQGVPVAIMLVAKLISFGCLNGASIGVCAMAGVNLGPFGVYKSRWIGGSAGELFEFSRPDSPVSRAYEKALKTVLTFGAKIVYIGSIDDQLVSLESSTFATIEHPLVYRAVFIDGRVHAPDFLSHLVGFALKLRNLGISDHGLIRELSSPLAGSLYSGEGHSRIYDDPAVYRLAVEFTLATSSMIQVPPKANKFSQGSQNPYILPFAMRGMLEEDHVRKTLQDETRKLLEQFDEWRPSTKSLKDVKFRLEGIRSKL